jgi:acetoin utilization deacetylase AcuC-like enzyme
MQRDSTSSADGNNEELDGLASNLSSMALEQPNLKRSISDRSTIEGSPILHPEKRIDYYAKTPILFRNDDEGCSSPRSALVLRIKVKGKEAQQPSSSSAFGMGASKAKNRSLSTKMAITPVSKGPYSQFLIDNGDGDDAMHHECIEDNEVPFEQKKVLIINSGGREGEQHNTGDHQENALRTALLCGPLGCLRRERLDDSLVWANDDSVYEAPMSDLLRCHEYSYLRHIQEKCEASQQGQGQGQGQGDNTKSSKHKQLPAFYAPGDRLDSDTPVGPHSLHAARHFCGAAMFAVDCLLGQDYCFASPRDAAGGGDEKVDLGTPPSSPIKNNISSSGGSSNGSGVQRINKVSRAFVVGRPPGHHCGPQGAVAPLSFWKRPEMTSSGFCLLNTAAVAAAYARYRYGRAGVNNAGSSGVNGSKRNSDKIRVAIIDIDIHHGNGTEAIVRNLQPHSEPLPLPSSWAPQWIESYKPWLDESDARDTFFGSVNLFAGDSFYPGSGSDSDERYNHVTGEGSNVVNVSLSPTGPGPADWRTRSTLSEKKKAEACEQASTEMRRKVTATLLPRLREFAPHLMIISAGFDAHYDDMYHYLTEQDYHWMTQELCRATEEGGGQVMSVLEGGYSLASALPKSGKGKNKQQAMPKTDRKTRNASGTGESVDSSLPSPPPKTAAAAEHAIASEDTDEQLQQQLHYGASSEDRFGIRPGDGGLVKGVMAHVAALCNRDDWEQQQQHEL